jgi:hypothetical protein
MLRSGLRPVLCHESFHKHSESTGIITKWKMRSCGEWKLASFAEAVEVDRSLVGAA